MAKFQLPVTPHKYQEIFLQDIKRYNVLVAHRRFGKTVCALITLILSATSTPKVNARYGYIAPFYKQAKQISWDYLKTFVGGFPGVKFNESELRVDFPNGARITLYGADNPHSMRGLYFDGVVVDEPAQCSPSLYGEILRPALSDRKGFVIFIGTPNGHDHFWELYNKALRSGNWSAQLYKASETGIVDADELAEAKSEMTDAEFEQEFECSFDVSAGDVVIPIEEINASIGRHIGYLQMGKVMGVDVGMSMGGDPSAIVTRQGGQVTHMEEFNMTDSIQIAGRVRDAFYDQEANHIVIDALTWGKGVYDILASWGLPVTGINVSERAAENERFANSRAELWFKARDFFAEKQCSLLSDHPLTDKLVAELSNLTYSHTPSGKRKVESKPDLAKRGVPSPNLADAFVLTMDSSAVGAIAFGRLEAPEQQNMLL
ncbi:conserved protein of unknown function [Pseudodesulfovibrio profundus]|uniref:Uncharacterized protein n=1 Tax=Pseudodesulfovibrio profundus TaxID=57320 RepID=A0A2C8FDU5_9BACT|nr:terminase family protein [Pseudodesulfovibrio profundus]SOB60631.1 conserved protein of unknown function [Pseudodesulfovibrio profundus]